MALAVLLAAAAEHVGHHAEGGRSIRWPAIASSGSRVDPYNGLGHIPYAECEMSDEQPDVDDEMNDERPHAEKNLGLFLNPGGAASEGGYLIPGPMSVGPGKPGPGDEWHVPVGPVETEQDVVLEPVHGALTDAEPRDRDER